MPPIEQVTADDYDLQFGTNVLGHWYFTKLLIPILIETAKSSPEGTARIVTTSSSGHTLVDKIDFDTLRGKENRARIKLGRVFLYNQSKFVSDACRARNSF